MAGGALAVILALLAALHLYWGGGGGWGRDAAIPRGRGGAPLFQPGAIACVVVALLLLAAGVLAQPWMPLDPWKRTQALRATAVLFALRAVGEFRYVGFFKREFGSPFAYWDTRFFSPLCLLIAFLSVAAA